MMQGVLKPDVQRLAVYLGVPAEKRNKVTLSVLREDLTQRMSILHKACLERKRKRKLEDSSSPTASGEEGDEEGSRRAAAGKLEAKVQRLLGSLHHETVTAVKDFVNSAPFKLVVRWVCPSGSGNTELSDVERLVNEVCRVTQSSASPDDSDDEEEEFPERDTASTWKRVLAVYWDEELVQRIASAVSDRREMRTTSSAPEVTVLVSQALKQMSKDAVSGAARAAFPAESTQTKADGSNRLLAHMAKRDNDAEGDRSARILLVVRVVIKARGVQSIWDVLKIPKAVPGGVPRCLAAAVLHAGNRSCGAAEPCCECLPRDRGRHCCHPSPSPGREEASR